MLSLRIYLKDAGPRTRIYQVDLRANISLRRSFGWLFLLIIACCLYGCCLPCSILCCRAHVLTIITTSRCTVDCLPCSRVVRFPYPFLLLARLALAFTVWSVLPFLLAALLSTFLVRACCLSYTRLYYMHYPIPRICSDGACLIFPSESTCFLFNLCRCFGPLHILL
jgi:hypothetical protein